MAGLTRRRQGEILREVFNVLAEEPEGLEARTVISRVENNLGLTDWERSEYPNRPGVRRFPKILRFTSINAVRGGWLVKEAGVWRLTPEGQDAHRRFTDPETFMREAVRRYNEWRRGREDGAGPNGSRGEDGAEGEEGPTLRETLEEARDTAFSDIRDYLGQLDPYEFQDVVAALVEAMGYHVVWVAPRGPDGGLDLLAQPDPLGVTGPRIKGQVKRRQDRARPDEIRALIGLIGTNEVGVFISLGGFTSEAEQLVRSQDSRRITLVDLEKLLNLWIEHYERLDEGRRQLLPLEPVHYLAPRS